ncbi:hypothetical protein [Algoriphagus boritolerans]|uniref:Uncharacterized protein n=1 Tax=Algoriphagus boritolerans DSM 17298 = JCM 18970 TaxID=1120964 RepID=A0A1H5TRP7_9BACT|nr:hypothetical protein [Algoriphagus boritolerans]SEF65552.1 hypothetical protein SAMN03080598_00907 [Algoriphagus boritolerans DSM 17298 = JCM 18970]
MDRRTFLTGLAGVILSEILLSDLDFNGTRTLNHTFYPGLPYHKTPPEWKGTPRLSDGTF